MPDPSDRLLDLGAAPVEVVPEDEAAGLVPLDPATRAALVERARAFVDDLARTDPRSPQFQRTLDDVVRLGQRDVRAASQVSYRLVQRPSSRPGGTATDAQEQVASALADLRRTITELDPSRADPRGPRRLLGLLPGAKQVTRPAGRHQDAQGQLDGIVRALATGQDALRRDNAAIEQEEAELRAVRSRLTRHAVLAGALDAAVQEKVAELSLTDPEAADALAGAALFPVRRRHQDLEAQLAVSAQGHLALNLVRRTNAELIDGVDRAQTTTVAALRTAVVVAQALSRQQRAVEQVGALSSAVDVEALHRAVDEVLAAVDAVDTSGLLAAAQGGGRP